MSDDHKVISIVVISIAMIVLAFIGWGCLSSLNRSKLDKQCLEAGKTIQWRSIEGHTSAYRECK